MYLAMDILTWAYCHSVDMIALCSGDGGYAEAIRRAKALRLRVEVYATWQSAASDTTVRVLIANATGVGAYPIIDLAEEHDVAIVLDNGATMDATPRRSNGYLGHATRAYQVPSRQ